jgi:hypothetical protein
MASRRARRRCREAGMRRRIACWWLTFPSEASRSGASSTTSLEAGL